eukprot:291626-Hanusia_phi.AAC.1
MHLEFLLFFAAFGSLGLDCLVGLRRFLGASARESHPLPSPAPSPSFLALGKHRCQPAVRLSSSPPPFSVSPLLLSQSLPSSCLRISPPPLFFLFFLSHGSARCRRQSRRPTSLPGRLAPRP